MADPADVSVKVAQDLGVSGTVKPRRGFFPETPLTMIYRRNLQPDDTLKSAAAIQGGISLGNRTINLFEGQWVTINASGLAVVATAANSPTGLAYPAFTGGERLDPEGGLTVILGSWVATTNFFDKGGTFSAGTLLMVGAGTVNINGSDTAVEGCLIPVDETVLAEVVRAVAQVERPPFGVNSETPDGIMQIRSIR